MNSYQISKLDCINLICYEAEQHKEKVASVPKFERGIIRLRAISTEVEQLKVLQEQDITGITVDKNQVREQLIARLAEMTGALQSYAHEKKENALYEKVNFSESALETLAKSELITVSSIIIAEADKMTPENLAGEGITAEELAELKESHESYNQVVNAPKKAIIDKSSVTEKIANLIDEAWEIKRHILDKLIGQFKRKDPDFYMKYQAASHLIHRRKSRGNGQNEENGNDEGKE